MKIAAAALGDHANLAAGRAAVLGAVVRRENLHLLHGVHVGNANAGTVGTRPDGYRAVEGHQEVLTASTVDIQWSGHCEIERRHRGTTPHTSLQKRQPDRVPAVEHHVLNLGTLHQPANRCRFRLDAGGGSDDFHSLGHGADLEGGIDRKGQVRVELVLGLDEPLKAGGFHRDGVETGRKIGDDKVASFIGGRPAFDAGCLVADANTCSGYARSGGVLDEAGDLGGIRLGDGALRVARDEAQEQRENGCGKSDSHCMYSFLLRSFAGRQGPLAWVFGDWQVNGIFTAQSGQPIDFTFNSATLNTPGNGNRPNVSGKPNIAGAIGRGELFFDTSAFSAPAPNTIGTAGRNLLGGPSFWNLDFSVFRHFPISERFKGEFRFESFNFTNTPHFNNPNGELGNPNFGQVTTAQQDQRQIQFGLKITF